MINILGKGFLCCYSTYQDCSLYQTQSNLHCFGQVDLESALVDQGVHAERVKNLKTLKAFIKKVSLKNSSKESLILTLKVDFRGSGKGNPGWVHFVEVSGMGVNESTENRSVSEDLAQQTEIITGMLCAKLLKGGGGFLPYKESFLMQLAGCNGCKDGQMVILSHVNAAPKHVKGSCCILSLTARLTQAVHTANRAIHHAGDEGAKLVHNTACIEVLKTLLENLRASNEGRKSTLMCFRKLTEDLCKCMERLNSAVEPIDDVFASFMHEVHGDPAIEKCDREKFEEILGHVRELAVGDEGKDKQLQAHASRANELSEELERCNLRKAELKKTLADYQENTNQDNNKLGNYAQQLEEMRQKMKALRETDNEKEEQLTAFQVSQQHNLQKAIYICTSIDDHSFQELSMSI